jgi:hypothetical protein
LTQADIQVRKRPAQQRSSIPNDHQRNETASTSRDIISKASNAKAEDNGYMMDEQIVVQDSSISTEMLMTA